LANWHILNAIDTAINWRIDDAKEYYGKRNKEISVQIEGSKSEEKRLSD
jgi:hypothetical protein